jgi:microcystin-dependent protein
VATPAAGPLDTFGVGAAGTSFYSNAAPTVPMAANAIGLAGGSQPHDNMQPFLAINFIISLFGSFPTQN